MRSGFQFRTALLAGVGALAIAGSAMAQARVFDIPAGDLKAALDAYARQSGQQLIYRVEDVRGKRSPGARGATSPDDALAQVLAGTPLAAARQTSGAVAIVPSPQGGAGAPPAGDAAQLTELQVTGTRIRGAAPVGATIIGVDRHDIEVSGYATTQDILRAIPQNYGGGPSDSTMGMSIRNGASDNVGRGASVNLRGLGPSSTLVLINGVRPALAGTSGTFADVSLIPTLAVSRIEVIADGSSALYGSDAVAGVVNVLLRKDFEGLETTARVGGAQDGAREYLAGGIVGRRWSGGHATAAYEYYRRGSLAATARPYATEDLRPFGGLDYRSNNSSPGTILAGGLSFAIPSGQNGVGLQPDQLIQGPGEKRDIWLDVDLLPRQERHAAYVTAEQTVGDHLRLSADLSFARRTFDTRTLGSVASAVTVPVTNPFYVDPIGTRQPVRVQYDFTEDLGAQRSSGAVQALNGVIGAEVSLADWSATLSAGSGEQRESGRTDNQLSTARLAAALADPNPATAYNLFGDPHSTPQATIDKVRGYSTFRGLADVWFVAAKADGPAFSLPAGQVKVALGAEHREESFKRTGVNGTTGLVPTPSANEYPDGRQVSAVYGEILAPLLGDDVSLPGIRRLEISLAGRFEHYSDFGSTTNPKVGVDWEPARGLVVRGAYGTSFRAPSFAEQLIGPNYVAYQPITIPDPQSPTGASTVLGLLGNTPDIGPEKAKTWTFGVEYRPPFLSGLRASATYYNIRYRDRIANPNSVAFAVLFNRPIYSVLINEAPSLELVKSYFNTPYLYNPDSLTPEKVQIILDLRVQNLAVVSQDGIDVDLSYDTSIGDNELHLGLTGSYIRHLKQAITKDAPKADVLGTVGNPVALRLRGEVGWSRGPFAATAFVNFVDGYSNNSVTPAAHVDAWTTADLQLAYSSPRETGPLKGLRASLSVSNVFDADPPYAVLRTPTSNIGFDADNASAIGRTVALQVTKSW